MFKTFKSNILADTFDELISELETRQEFDCVVNVCGSKIAPCAVNGCAIHVLPCAVHGAPL